MNVLVTRKIPESGLQLLKEAGCTLTEHTQKRELAKDELISLCKKHDALLSVGRNFLDKHVLQECRHLKAISLMSAGFDNVDIDAATRLKRPIGHTPGVLSRATSDIAFLLMLAVSRNAFYMHHQMKHEEWGFFEPTENLGMELYGKTLGVSGLGKIGFELAKKCISAYNMDVIYHNRGRNRNAEEELKAVRVSFDELLERSDVLSAHVNLTSETRGMFDARAFEKMKPTAIFINTSRGAVHNEKDLTEALRQKSIWGAGLDVTHPEPMQKENPLLYMPNVCVLPHIGSATAETRAAMATRAARNIIAGLKGEKMPYVANPEVYEGKKIL